MQRLALELSLSSRALAGAFGRQDGDVEILVAGWADGPALSSVSMTVVARAVSTAKAALQARVQAITTLVDRERTRIAFALHDGLTQTVAGAVLQLEALHKVIERDPEEALKTLDESKREMRKSLAELRGVLFDLSQTEEEGRKTGEPLTRYVEDVVRRWRLPARVAVEGDLSEVPGRTLSVAYVVIREALANAAKHAAARNVTVRLTAGEHDLVVTVGDSGPGFTHQQEEEAREAHHVGLDLLRRRVREVGGRLRVESQPGKGTRITARLPIRRVAS
jgi:signal transduction histidine kinase